MKKIIGRTALLSFLLLQLGLKVIAAPPDRDSLNNPYTIRPLKIQLLLLTLDQINMGAGIQADYHFKHAVLEAQYRRVYLTLGGKPDPTGDKEIYSTNVANNFNNIDISGEYYFADYLVSKRYQNILSTTSTSYTYNTGFGQARRIFAVKAGIFMTSGFVFTDSAAHYVTNYTTLGFAAGLARKRIDSRPSKSHFRQNDTKNKYKHVINEFPTVVCLCTPEVHDSFKIHRCC